jgi:hypothetical protein
MGASTVRRIKNYSTGIFLVWTRYSPFAPKKHYLNGTHFGSRANPRKMKETRSLQLPTRSRLVRQALAKSATRPDQLLLGGVSVKPPPSEDLQPPYA